MAKRIVDYKRLKYNVECDLAIADWSDGIRATCRRIARRHGCLAGFVYRHSKPYRPPPPAKYVTEASGCVRWLKPSAGSRRAALRAFGFPAGTMFKVRLVDKHWSVAMQCNSQWCHNPRHAELTSVEEIRQRKQRVAADIHPGVSLIDVAKRHGISPERVYQIMLETKPGLRACKWIAIGPSYRERALRELRSGNNNKEV